MGPTSYYLWEYWDLVEAYERQNKLIILLFVSVITLGLVALLVDRLHGVRTRLVAELVEIATGTHTTDGYVIEQEPGEQHLPRIAEIKLALGRFALIFDNLSHLADAAYGRIVNGQKIETFKRQTTFLNDEHLRVMEVHHEAALKLQQDQHNYKLKKAVRLFADNVNERRSQERLRRLEAIDELRKALVVAQELAIRDPELASKVASFRMQLDTLERTTGRTLTEEEVKDMAEAIIIRHIERDSGVKLDD